MMAEPARDPLDIEGLAGQACRDLPGPLAGTRHESTRRPVIILREAGLGRLVLAEVAPPEDLFIV